MKKIIVASKNPVKMNAALAAFQKMFPSETFEIEGITVPSGVSDQPKSETESFEGALNRVVNAAAAYPGADFWVGMESGVHDHQNQMGNSAWMVVRGKNGKFGKARTSTFFLPDRVAKLVRAGKELGEADDIVFGGINSKQKNGAVGILTENVVTRTDYYTEAMLLALIPFKNEHLYPHAS